MKAQINDGEIEINLDGYEDEYFLSQTFLTSGSKGHGGSGRTNLQMPLDTALKLETELHKVNEELKSKLNAKIAKQNPELVAKEIADVIDEIEKVKWGVN